MRNVERLVVALCVLLVLTTGSEGFLVPPPVSAQNGVPKYIAEYEVPTANSAPLAISVDANGKVWFTESNASKLGIFDPTTESFTEYEVPWLGDMWSVITDLQGHVWFTQYSGKGNVSPGGAIVGGGSGRIVRFDIATKNFTSILIPTNGSFPMRLAMDQVGRVWFTEFLGNKVGVFDPVSNHMQEYRVPTNFSGPADLTFDSHGTLWFSESFSQQLGRFDPQSQSFTEYHLSAQTASQIVSSPVGVAMDKRGNVWIADHGGNWIVEFNPQTQRISKYPTHFPPKNVYPISIVNDVLVDYTGRVWFAEHGGNSIGYYDPGTRTMVEFAIPTGPISSTLWLALAPNGDVWFAEWSGNKIGVVHATPFIPISISTPMSSLILSQGQQVTIPLQIKTLQGLQGNGTLLYAWGSYNQIDVSGTFSPQYPVLTGPTEISAQAQFALTKTAQPGNYTLALGIETQSFRVLSMISVEVLTANSSTTIPLLNLAALGLVVVIAVAALIFVRRSRSQGPHV